MANSYFRQFFYTKELYPVTLYATVTFGASGAPTLNKGLSKGIQSITRNSAGDYTIAFGDKYNSFLMADSVFNSGSSAPAAPGMYVKTDSVASAGTIEIVFNAAGTATDPASGEIVKLSFTLRNSST